MADTPSLTDSDFWDESEGDEHADGLWSDDEEHLLENELAEGDDQGQVDDYEPDGNAPGVNDFDISPQARGTESASALDTPIRVYMNVGAWGKRQTLFGLVSGGEVALCSWLEHPNSIDIKTDGKVSKFVNLGYKKSVAAKAVPKVKVKRSRPMDERKAKLGDDSKIRAFIEAAHGKGYAQAGPVALYTAPKGFKFIGEDQLLIFFPDMHINLLRSFPCDGFWRTDARGRKVSLERDLGAMLGFVEEFDGANADVTVRVYHLGDLYDVWHMQGVFDVAYEAFLEEKESTQSRTYRPKKTLGLRKKTVTNLVNDADLAEEWKQKTVGEVFSYLKKHNELRDKIDETQLNTWVNGLRCKDKVVNPLLWQTVEANIEEQYPLINWDLIRPNPDGADHPLFKGYIRGNHDMDEDNPYLVNVFDEHLDFEAARTTNTNYGEAWPKLDDESVSDPRYGDGDGRVRWEHGHASDPYNNCLTFMRFDDRPRVYHKESVRKPGGWPNTRDFVRDLFKGSSWWKETKSAQTVKIANHYLQQYARWRANRVLRQLKDVNLVVLGHTHIGHLADLSGVKAKKFRIKSGERATYQTATDRVDTPQETVTINPIFGQEMPSD